MVQRLYHRMLSELVRRRISHFNGLGVYWYGSILSTLRMALRSLEGHTMNTSHTIEQTQQKEVTTMGLLKVDKFKDILNAFDRDDLIQMKSMVNAELAIRDKEIKQQEIDFNNSNSVI